MRKRVSRPRRFAAIDNDAIDTLPSILGVGLLTALIRAKDGDDVTVETLSERYEEGEKSLTKAMRSLVDGAYVVKFKIQRAASEITVEDGKEVPKRGGSWYTTFTVDSIPFTREDVAAMLEDIYAEGNVKSHRVEPTRLDPRGTKKAPERPTSPGGGVGATCDDEALARDSGSRPTPPSGAPGRPTPGQGGAHIRNKTSSAHTESLEDGDDAPSGGVAPVGARSASPTGSREAAREGGSAASNKSKHTRQQIDLARQVRAYYPEHLLHGWTHPDSGKETGPLPELPSITQAILDALEGDVPGADRTPAQLGARIEQRWNQHGYATAFYAGELENPVGAAIAMVRPLKASDKDGCSNPRCDAGVDVDTGESCRACPERLAARKAQRRQERAQATTEQQASEPAEQAPPPAGPMPAQRRQDPQGKRRECQLYTCSMPFSDDSEDVLCPRCRRLPEARAELERQESEMQDLAAWRDGPQQRKPYATTAPF